MNITKRSICQTPCISAVQTHNILLSVFIINCFVFCLATHFPFAPRKKQGRSSRNGPVSILFEQISYFVHKAFFFRVDVAAAGFCELLQCIFLSIAEARRHNHLYPYQLVAFLSWCPTLKLCNSSFR